MLICFADCVFVIMNMYPISVQILTWYIENIMVFVVFVINLFRFNFDFFVFKFCYVVCVLILSLFLNCFFLNKLVVQVNHFIKYW